MALSLGLSGCTTNGRSLAEQACRHVEVSLAIYRQAEQSPASDRGRQQQRRALQELRIALPLAASAAGESSTWQALMATLAESTRIPESDLAHALQAQCSLAGPGTATTTTAST